MKTFEIEMEAVENVDRMAEIMKMEMHAEMIEI
jgi:hypothetical protein